VKLVLHDRALADIESIFNWIAQDSPAAARAVADRLLSSAELLQSFPGIGRAGLAPGTLEWVVPRLPYILVYEVDRSQERLVVVAVFHGAQRRDVGDS
jgi:plasmid stabilization system protein ParE